MSNVEDHVRDRDIAIIGMAGRFPKAMNLDTFWQNLQQGVEGMTVLSDEELLAAGNSHADINDPQYVKASMELDGVELFDADFFGYAPREAAIMDPQQRLFLEYAWEALEHAGYNPYVYDGLIGVYAGVAWNTYLLSNLTQRRDLFGAADIFQVFITSDKDFMPTRVSYKLNLKGPSVIIQTSCSTSLVALHTACLNLLAYECDMALVGGVTVKVPQKSGYLYQEGGLASPDGHCRAFDARGRGTIFGSGIGMVVLKRLAEALDDGDTVHAVIKGSAINNDGSLKVSYTAPSVEGQAEVIAAAQSVAEVDIETIQYVEAHGTGTELGDPIEVAALTKVFRESTDKKQFCALGSVKSNVGHLDAAAGIAGLLKTVLSLKHRQLPPSLHFEEPNPKIDFDNSPFYVNATLSEWNTNGVPRRAGVSSFGVGGTNAHVIVEEAPTHVPTTPSRPWQMVLLSARSDAALAQATTNLAHHFAQHPAENLADAAYTLATGRVVFRHRRAVICRDATHLQEIIATDEPNYLVTDTDTQEPRHRPVAFLFPGQGSQYVQMAQQLYQTESRFRMIVDQCATILQPQLGADIRTVLYPALDDEEAATAQLNQTAIAQSALFVVEYALAQVFMAWGIRPYAMLGHSIGEYVAACIAGVMTLEDALTVVAARGRLMQAQPTGAMLSVAMAEHHMRELLGAEVSLAAINGPEQCVVAGSRDAIAKLEEQLIQQAVPCRRLHTSHAFHSAMMDAMLDQFATVLQRIDLQPPQIPYLSNVTGTWITDTEATDPQYWVRHVRQPVRFADGIATIVTDPTCVLLEVGPGTNLSTLARRHPDASHNSVMSSMRHAQTQFDDLAYLLGCVGRLWLAGVMINWQGFYEDEQRQRTPLPTYPFERQRYWIDPGETHDTLPQSLPATPGKDPDLSRWLYLPSWKRTLPPTPLTADTTIMPQTWLIFIDTSEVGVLMAQRLTTLGARVIQVVAGADFAQETPERYVLNPAQPEQYVLLMQALREQQMTPDGVLHLWGLTPARVVRLTVSHFVEAQQQGFYSLLFFVQALTQQDAFDQVRMGVITNNTQYIANEVTISPENSTIAGLCKVIPQEYLQVVCCHIDITLPTPDQPLTNQRIDQLLADVVTQPADLGITYRDHQRWVQVFEPVTVAPTDQATGLLRAGGSYVVIGGLSGIGFILARHLAQVVQARLTLVEDAHFPVQSTWDDWLATHNEQDATSHKIRQAQQLIQAGTDCTICPTDTTTVEGLQAATTHAHTHFGAIHGVIHAAGMLGEQSFCAIQEMRTNDADLHFIPQAHGVIALAEAIATQSLDFCVVASSLTSVLGGRGYAAYTATNLFLDAFVQHHNRTSPFPWMSVNWDAWQLEDELQITTMRSDLAQLAMNASEAGQILQRILTIQGGGQMVVSTSHLPTRIQQWMQQIAEVRDLARLDSGGGTAQRHPRPKLPTPYVAPASDMEHAIADIWQTVLGFEQIGVQDNFFDLGGDSLIAIRVMTQLKARLHVDIPVVKLYQGLTIRALADIITATQDGQAIQQRSEQLAERKEQVAQRKNFQHMRRSRRG